MEVNKHNLVYQDLSEKITSKVYPTHSFLPSENRLCQLYGASRDTIRKALRLLQDNGYIQKIKGKGSVVLDTEQFVFPVSGVTSYQELVKNQEMKSETTIFAHEDVDVDPNHFSHTGEMKAVIPCTYLGRLRIVDGEPIIIDKDYIVKAVVPMLPAKLPQQSLYAYFEDELGLAIGYARKEFTVEPTTLEDQKLMHLKPSDMVVVIRSETYLSDTRLFQFTESRHRPDRFRFVDFARRNKI